MSLTLKGAVVIVDEGHNIEDSARDGMSFNFTLEEFIIAARDFKRLG